MYFATLVAFEATVVFIVSRQFRKREAWPPRLPRTRRHMARVVGLFGLAAVTAISPIAISVGPLAVRSIFAICALLLAPGVAVIAFWSIRDTLDELLLTFVVSVAILVLSGMVMLWLQIWNPPRLLQILTVIAAPTITWHAFDAMIVGDRASSVIAQEHDADV